MTGERAVRPLQAGLTLTVNFGNPWKIVIPSELLAMLTEETRKIVMDEAVNDNQRFKALIEELHRNKDISVKKLSKRLSVPLTTLWKWMRYKMNVKIRDNVTASQLANARHPKRDFDGDDVEKLRLWFFAHTDGSVGQYGQQVKVELVTPDPYLALLFKEVFGKYGHVGVAPHRNDKGEYKWKPWILLPLKSYWWLLEQHTPTLIDNNEKLYDVLGITIDTEGSLYAWNPKGRRAAKFAITFYNEKECVIKPLHAALKQHYKALVYITPKGKVGGYGCYNDDYYRVTVYTKTNVKDLLEKVKLALPQKRLKALLIKSALKDPSRPVYWESIEPMYSKIKDVYEGLLRESKLLAKSFYTFSHTLKEKRKQGEVTHTEYEKERARLEAEIWKTLQALKEKYDKRFKEVEKRIEACFRAQKPLLTNMFLMNSSENFQYWIDQSS